MDTPESGSHKRVHAEVDLALGQNFGFEFEKDFNPRAVSFKEHNLSILVNFMYRFQCVVRFCERTRLWLKRAADKDEERYNDSYVWAFSPILSTHHFTQRLLGNQC